MVDDHKSVLYVRDVDDDNDCEFVCVLFFWFETHKHIEYMSMLLCICLYVVNSHDLWDIHSILIVNEWLLLE